MPCKREALTRAYRIARAVARYSTGGTPARTIMASFGEVQYAPAMRKASSFCTECKCLSILRLAVLPRIALYSAPDITACIHAHLAPISGPRRLGIRPLRALALVSNCEASSSKCSTKPHRPSRSNPKYFKVVPTWIWVLPMRIEVCGGRPREPSCKKKTSVLCRATLSPKSLIEPTTHATAQFALVTASSQEGTSPPAPLLRIFSNLT